MGRGVGVAIGSGVGVAMAASLISSSFIRISSARLLAASLLSVSKISQGYIPSFIPVNTLERNGVVFMSLLSPEYMFVIPARPNPVNSNEVERTVISNGYFIKH